MNHSPMTRWLLPWLMLAALLMGALNWAKTAPPANLSLAANSSIAHARNALAHQGNIDFGLKDASGAAVAAKGGTAAAEEAAGVATVKQGGTVELFTNERGVQVPGAVGVGPNDAAAVAADARNMANIPSNSQARVIANNPYIPSTTGTGSMMDFLPEAARITESGGEIIINGTARNPYFNSIPTAEQLDALGLKISYQGGLPSEFQGMTFTTTQGGNIPTGSMQTIIFIEK